ncbi:MAG: IS66 family insertion sequence element accessory protein TnpB [Bacilli bacterium]|jgi:transposase
MNELFGETRKIFLYPGTTDMRLGIFGLIRKVTSPGKDCAYVFCSKSRVTAKILIYGGNHVWLLQKRLFRGRFPWPQDGNVTEVSDEMLRFLMVGIDKVNDIELKGGDRKYSLF